MNLPRSAARPWVVNLMLVVAVMAVFAVPLALRLNTAGKPADEAYAGTDATAAQVVSQVDPDYRPWFSPLFEPSSGEIESGLFAMQAALGAGLFGFALGRLSGRRRGAPFAASVREQPGPAVRQQLSPTVVPVVVSGEPARPVGGA